MRVLVLGGEGMLGHKMFQTLVGSLKTSTVICTIRGRRKEPFYEKIGLFKLGDVVDRVDVTNAACLEATLRAIRPHFIVNCIGIIKQRDAANAAVPSIGINALLPHQLAEWAQEWDGRVIHFSTDCVFSGRKGSYSEQDPSDAEDLYGRSKFLGEVATQNGLTLRTSIIGRELSEFRSLLEWFLAQSGRSVRGYKRAIYSGVTTNYIARLVSRIVTERPDLSGLYQVTSVPISKYELLTRLRDAYQMNVTIEPDDSESCDRSMNGERFVAQTKFATPAWDVLINELVSDPTPYNDWRA
jgi:dTDP-4-dehydrorhamnose reductase